LTFFDPGTKSLVWCGIGTKTIDPSGNPQKNMERLEKGIAKILKHFPHPQTGNSSSRAIRIQQRAFVIISASFTF
jgi:hypothetical protein